MELNFFLSRKRASFAPAQVRCPLLLAFHKRGLAWGVQRGEQLWGGLVP